MEPVRPPSGPPSGPVAPQAVARVTPLGRGWMLLAVEAGFVLRHAAKGIEQPVQPDKAEALRRGDIAPEALAGRFLVQIPPPSVTVAFSPEAMRLSGQIGAAKAGRGGKPMAPSPRQAGFPRLRLSIGWIGAGCLALLVLVLVWTG